MKSLRSRETILALAIAAALILSIALANSGLFSHSDQQPAPRKERPSTAMSASPHGSIARITAMTLAMQIHPRTVNTWGEIETRSFVFDSLQRYGYYPRTQEFISDSGGVHVHSGNIIAIKEGVSTKQIVVGAHYDSEGADQGYLDNASGVGLLIELAARLKSKSAPYTIVFVAFGAGERGTLGAHHYLASLDKAQRAATIGVLDLDTVAGGSRLVVTNRSSSTAFRDSLLATAKRLHIELAARSHAPEMTGGDEATFASHGIATASLASTGWKPLPSSPHSLGKDSVTFVEKTYPKRVQRQLTTLSRLLETFLLTKKPEASL